MLYAHFPRGTVPWVYHRCHLSTLLSSFPFFFWGGGGGGLCTSKCLGIPVDTNRREAKHHELKRTIPFSCRRSRDLNRNFVRRANNPRKHSEPRETGQYTPLRCTTSVNTSCGKRSSLQATSVRRYSTNLWICCRRLHDSSEW